jgi:cold shock CspA family protein
MTTINYKQEYEKYKSKYEEYNSKYWKKHHETKSLKQENIELQKRIDIYESAVLYGEVKRLSNYMDYGIISSHKYGDIFFHSSQCKFNMNTNLIGKKVKFNLMINKRLEAINLELEINDSLSAFDILDSGIYKQDSLRVDELTDNNSDSSFESCIDEPVINSKSEESDIKTIKNARKIWYMNYRTHQANKGWFNMIDNGFVCTWQKDNANQRLFDKLVIGDIIAWYTIGIGYSAILRVKDNCSYITDDDLKIWHTTEESLKEHHEWAKKCKCRIIKIPVEFLAYTDLYNCIKKQSGWSTSDWTSGFRGPNAISPTSPRWTEQVVELYKCMKNI